MDLTPEPNKDEEAVGDLSFDPKGMLDADDGVLDELFPAERAAPIVTVLDGHPHTLSFLGSVRAVPVTSLGVQIHGGMGLMDDLPLERIWRDARVERICVGGVHLDRSDGAVGVDEWSAEEGTDAQRLCMRQPCRPALIVASAR